MDNFGHDSTSWCYATNDDDTCRWARVYYEFAMTETGALDSSDWATRNKGSTKVYFDDEEFYSLEYDFTFKKVGGESWEPELHLDEKAIGYGPSS